MNQYYSVEYVSRNEQGDEEITVEHHLSFWQKITKQSRRKEVFVGSGTVWYNKNTMQRCSSWQELENIQIRFWTKYQSN